jgi:hypothetical protein
MLILAVNMEETLASLGTLAARDLVVTSGFELFDDVLKYLKSQPFATLGCCHTALYVSGVASVGKNLNHSFA